MKYVPSIKGIKSLSPIVPQLETTSPVKCQHSEIVEQANQAVTYALKNKDQHPQRVLDHIFKTGLGTIVENE
jgi:hypothetical protein